MKNSSMSAVMFLFYLPCLVLWGCTGSTPGVEPAVHEEVEPIARTEFTDRVENFFEYEPLRAGHPSQFRIHLTDLSDGSPVEKAQVDLTVRPKGGGDPVARTTAKVGKVTGIYVAELVIPQAGAYDVEFHIQSAKLDERLLLTDFKVE